MTRASDGGRRPRGLVLAVLAILAVVALVILIVFVLPGSRGEEFPQPTGSVPVTVGTIA